MKPICIRRCLWALGSALFITALPTHGYDIPPPPPPMYQDLILPLFPNARTIPFSGESGSGGKRSAGSPRGATLAEGTAQTEANARELAMAIPGAQREQMRQAYLQAFDTYRQLERKLKLPANDVAGSTAAFIAGNYMAFRDVDVPDPTFYRLVGQVRSALLQNRGYLKLSAAGKRQLYEQTAMVGTFMAVARLSFQQRPNPAAQRNFREAARNNLESTFKVPAEQVRIDEKGLHLGQQGG